MNAIQNLVEYYDELYPVTAPQYDFYKSLLGKFSSPVRFLSIGCGTGVLESRLAKETADVTGIETIKELLESATRKHRTQLMALRFFKMSTIEMARFLGKKFYNVISCLNNRIVFIHDTILMKKFFFDCKQLLADGGIVILHLMNYDLYKNKTPVFLPERKSIRVKMTDKLERTATNEYVLTKTIETGNGKIVPLYTKIPVHPITVSEIQTFAKEAGFSSVKIFNGYETDSFDSGNSEIVAIIE